MRFEVERIDPVTLDGADELLGRNLMSPFAWIEDGDVGVNALVRAVASDRTKREESGRLWFGRSGSDGLLFHMNYSCNDRELRRATIRRT